MLLWLVTHTAFEMAPHAPAILSEKWNIRYSLLLAMFDPLHSSMNQKLFYKHLCNRSSHYEKYRWYLLRREAITCYHQIDTLLSAKMNGTQRRTLVSPWRMHCTYCGMPKGTPRAEAMLNREKIKSVALAVIELRLSEGISQSVR